MESVSQQRHCINLIAPFVLVIAAKGILTKELYFLAFLVFGYGHYVAALVYTRFEQIQWRNLLLLGVVIGVAANSMAVLFVPAAVYFLVHWIFADFSLNNNHPSLTPWRSLALVSWYFWFFYDEIFIGIWEIPMIKEYLFYLMSVGWVLYLAQVIKMRKLVSRFSVFVDCCYLPFGFAMLSFEGQYLLNDLLLLHALQFSIFYFPKARAPQMKYVWNHVWIFVAALLIAYPPSPFYSGIVDLARDQQFYGYLHITLSFFLSHHSPGWFSKGFTKYFLRVA